VVASTALRRSSVAWTYSRSPTDTGPFPPTGPSSPHHRSVPSWRSKAYSVRPIAWEARPVPTAPGPRPPSPATPNAFDESGVGVAVARKALTGWTVRSVGGGVGPGRTRPPYCGRHDSSRASRRRRDRPWVGRRADGDRTRPRCPRDTRQRRRDRPSRRPRVRGGASPPRGRTMAGRAGSRWIRYACIDTAPRDRRHRPPRGRGRDRVLRVTESDPIGRRRVRPVAPLRRPTVATGRGCPEPRERASWGRQDTYYTLDHARTWPPTEPA
jgi:hypothetical protein